MELRIKDLQTFYGISEKTASHRYKEIQRYFKNEKKRLTFNQLSIYENIDIKLINSLLRV